MNLSGWPGVAARRWIEQILLERMGYPFELTSTDGAELKLSLPGFQGFIQFECDPGTFNRNDSALPCVSWGAVKEGWTPPGGQNLPVPGKHTLRVPLIQKESFGFVVHYDLLGMVYWILSRSEEVGRSDLDEHERFSARNSHAMKYDYLERPIVDEWLSILRDIICINWPELKLLKHKFSMRVSHDVDEPSRYAFRSLPRWLRAIGGDIIKRRDVGGVLKALIVKFTSRKSLSSLDPANTFDWIMAQSEKEGIASAFYFICGRTDLTRDADYELEHPAIRELLRRINKRGHEIGLHPSYNSYLSNSVILGEVARLRRVCLEEGIVQAAWGGRMHFLRWSQPATLRAWDEASMSYDSTLGYAELVGFRCGTCFEYPAFDPVSQEILNVRIRPLIVMDVTLTSTSYLALGYGDAAFEKVKMLKDACRTVDGQFTLLWHNNNLVTEEERRLYLWSLKC